MVLELEERSRKEYVDRRNWPEYNEELVVRGTFYLNFDFAKNWDKELKKMNEGKRGGQYKFPNSFISWLAIWHQLVDYRGLEGISRQLQKSRIIPHVEDFTTAWYRIHDFVPDVKLPSFKKLNIATDLTGMHPGNGGRYLEFKYGRRGRGKYIAVIITVDVKHHKLLMVDAHIEGEGTSEPDIGIEHGKKLIGKGFEIEKANGDGRYDTDKTFDFWDKNDTKTAIPPRKNAKIRSSKSKRRKREIREYKKLGLKRWYHKKHYGERLAVEGENSAVKRKYGENLVGKTEDSMCAEAIQKFVFYDFLKDYGAERAR